MRVIERFLHVYWICMCLCRRVIVSIVTTFRNTHNDFVYPTVWIETSVYILFFKYIAKQNFQRLCLPLFVCLGAFCAHERVNIQWKLCVLSLEWTCKFTGRNSWIHIFCLLTFIRHFGYMYVNNFNLLAMRFCKAGLRLHLRMVWLF